jgi:hypothetical protein
MDRPIVYPGSIPLDTDVLRTNQDVMAALGGLLAAVIGSGTTVDGLAISATTAPSMVINIAPGTIVSLTTLEGLGAYGALVQDTVTPLVKMGQNLTSTAFTLTAPGTAGQSINYMIEATFLEVDAGSTVLAYYNAGNPSVPYSGPTNSGTAQMTLRNQRVSLQLKAGAAATTGTQTTPAVDGGWVGLYVVTINFGQTTITNANLAAATMGAAPFIRTKLPKFSAIPTPTYITATGAYSWTVPVGVYFIDVEAVGGGGGGAGGNGTLAGGGGGGSSKGRIKLAVNPGDVITGTIGTGGAGGGTGVNNGAAGTATTVVYNSITYTAGGGFGGQVASAIYAGGNPGVGTNFSLNISTGGTDGTGSGNFGGNGAPGLDGLGGGRAGASLGKDGGGYGAGGGASYGGTAGPGGIGSAGIVVFRV